MNIVSASALAGLSALVTVWVLSPDVAAPTSSTVAEMNRGIFMRDRSVQLAAIAGTCETRTDVGESLLGDGPTESSDPAVAAPAPPPEQPAMETAAIAPIGGTCGARPPAEIDDGSAAVTAPTPAEPSPGTAKPEVAAAEAKPETERKPPPKTKPRPKQVLPPKEPLTAWWPARRTDALNVLFVGEASFGSAISVLTDGQFENADSANERIEVRSSDGAIVKNRWRLSTNRQMLLLVVEPGVYTVSIQPELTDAKGRQVSEASGGKVYVR